MKDEALKPFRSANRELLHFLWEKAKNNDLDGLDDEDRRLAEAMLLHEDEFFNSASPGFPDGKSRMKNTLKIGIDAPNFQCILHRGQRYGFEIKFNEAPNVRKSMRVALNDLKLDHLWVIYLGQHRYPVDDKITVLPIGSIHEVA